MRLLLRAFVLAGVFGLCLAAVASAQDIPTGATLSCPSGKIYIDSCNIRDTSDNSTCLVGHPDTIMPNGLMKYTNETRGNLKKLMPTCKQPTAAQTGNKKSNPTQSAAANQPGAPSAASAASAAPSGAASPAAPVTSLMVQSVSIQNSPGVPDTGGHCIICGLVTGSLTAVEPNLVICVTPTGTTGGRRTCTAICPPGHDCKKELSGGVRLNGANPSVHVEVLDNDKQGKIQQLAAFDESDATQCTTAQPCKVNDADDQAAGTLVSFAFANRGPEGSAAPTSGSGAGSNLVTSSMTVSGKLPPVTLGSAEELTGNACHGPYASVDEAVKKDSYGRQALKDTVGTTEHGFVILRDPSQKSGGYYASPPIASKSPTLKFTVEGDYAASRSQAVCGTKNISMYDWVATVHTHPDGVSDYNNNFTPDDFSQGIQIKMNFPKVFQEIVMIYVKDGGVRTFVPEVNDCAADSKGPSLFCAYICCPFGHALMLLLDSGVNPSLSPLWSEWAAPARTHIITTYK